MKNSLDFILSDDSYSNEQNDSLYKIAYSNFKAPVLFVNIKCSKIEYANQAAIEFYGWTLKQLKSMNLSEINLLDKSEMQIIFDKVKKGQKEEFNSVHRLSDGTTRGVKLTGDLIEIMGNEFILVTICDLEVLDRVERVFKENEEKYSSLFNNSIEPCILLNEKGIVRDCNTAFSEFYGKKKEEIINVVHPGDFCPKVQADGFRSSIKGNELISKGLAEGNVFFNWTMINHEGKLIYANVSGAKIVIDDKTYLLITWRDHTDKYLTELRREHLAARYNTLFYSPTVGIGILDSRESVFLEVNDKLIDMTEYSRKELLEKDPYDLINDSQIIEAMGKDRKTVGYERIIKTKHGMDIYVNIGMYGFPEGGRLLIYCIIKDITEEVKKRKEKEEWQEIFYTMLEKSDVSYWDLNLNEGTISFSKNWFKMLGHPYKKKLDVLVLLEKLCHPEDIKIAAIAYETYRKGDEKSFSVEVRTKDVNNEWRWMRGESISRMADGKGGFERVVGVLVDINDYKQNEILLHSNNKKLEEAMDRAVESDHLKSAFLANLSHEIRTPMNGIVGFARMLDRPDLTVEKRKNYVTIIQNSSDQLLKIINDVLEISQLETKKFFAKKSELNLNNLLMELFSVFSLKAKENKLHIYLKKALADKNAAIFTDESKLRKILSNLIENALKYTIKGYIEIGYEVLTDGLIIYVKDTGVGIASESKDVVFGRFSQAKNELSDFTEGLGLGLSIAKENAELLGGNLWFESKIGQGTTFFLKIPNSDVENIMVKKNLLADNKGNNSCDFKILIAEDEEVNFLYIEELLIQEFNSEFELIHAKNGQEAIDLYKENPDVKLVLMDIKMPILDGFEATKALKKINHSVPIVAQTAYTTKSNKDKAIKFGCDDYISKPINKDELIEMINKYVLK